MLLEWFQFIKLDVFVTARLGKLFGELGISRKINFYKSAF